MYSMSEREMSASPGEHPVNINWVTVTIVLLLTSIIIYRDRFSQGEAVERRVRGHICS